MQLRNSAEFRTADGKFVLAGLVDASGYSTDVAEKYQGFLITEVKLNVEGTILPPIEYGFGFSKDGKFLVTDVGANDLFTVAAHLDENPALGRPLDDRGGPKLSEPRFIPALRRQEMGQSESTVRDLEVSPTKAATNRIPV